MKTCTVDGCQRGVLARGYCAPHYSTWHRSQRKYCITCAQCGATAQMGHKGAKYCSKLCSAQAHQAAATAGSARQQKHWAGRSRDVALMQQPIRARAKRRSVCTALDCLADAASRGMCLSHYDTWQRHKRMPVRFTAGQCRVCGTGFVSTIRNDITCSATCQALQRAHTIHTCTARRRARLKAAFVSDVSRTQVFERDRYRCHLCGRRTLRTKRSPHPRSPSVDHVMPLARGGTHEPANCRTACLRCNIAKGARGGGEQLILTA